ncbi:hypothetical protein ACJMK2_034853 [Sinanodonta woodiana]|uniref:Uncharacterized protein n=1 Tax=Sinanodonta woodiana TaxID=1069815 RepID=A0ABD3WV36_SINWO
MTSRPWDSVTSWKYVTLVLLILMSKLSFGLNATYIEEQKLWSFLLQDYNIDIPPSRPLSVSVTFSFRALVELDIAKQKMVFGGIFVFTWNDPRLSWNVSQYPVRMTRMTKVWRPVFIIINSLAGTQWIWNEFNMVPLALPNGNMFLEIPAYSECKCDVNPSLFPFDEQICAVEIIGWPIETIYPSFGNQQTPDDNATGLDIVTYTGNGEWKLIDYGTRNTSIEYCCSGQRAPTLTFFFKFKRLNEFYMVNFILPSVAMSVLVVWTFILPVETGERVSYSLTIMLSYTVLLTLLSSLLPSASINMPYIAIYLLGIMLLCALGTSLTALSVHLYHRRDPVPIWIKRLCCRSGSSQIIPKRSRKELPYSFANDCDAKSNTKKVNINRSWQQGRSVQYHPTWKNTFPLVLPISKKIPSYAARTRARKAHTIKTFDICIDDDSDNHAKISWSEVSVNLDFVCFWVFLVIVVCSNIVLFVLITR